MSEDPHEDLVRRLLKLSGGRPAVSEAVADRVRGSVHSHWKQSVRNRTRKKLTLLFAGSIAASLLLFTFSWYFNHTPSSVAVVEYLTGQVILGEDKLLFRGGLVPDDSTVESGDSGRVLLRTMKGVTLRLDLQTRVHFESESSFLLERGAVYFDSGKWHSKFHVSTPMGVVANRGTQFEIRLQESGMEVRVREGSVSLTNQNVSQEISAGNRLSIDAAGKIRMSEFAKYGPEWDWVARVSPLFPLEGRTLTEFLTWITHENGWVLNLSKSKLQESHGKVVLHGSVENLSPAQMLEAVLPVCGLTYSLDQGVLTVNPAERK